jgi:hypothetical protein
MPGFMPGIHVFFRDKVLIRHYQLSMRRALHRYRSLDKPGCWNYL